MKPFHLSFVVPELERVKPFYLDLLGCEIGRDAGNWFDINFFGHQITLHQEQKGMPAKPVDHFGPILDKAEWLRLLDLFRSHDFNFEREPLIKAEGTDKESGKFMVADPAGNRLEFKYYADFDTTLKRHKP